MSSQNLREHVTFAMRLLFFLATLAIMGAFFLPWTRLDGMSQSSSGADLVALLFSPSLGYLGAVSPLQTTILIGCPALLISAAVAVSVKYAQRETAPVATFLVFASSIFVIYATSDLTARKEVGTLFGLTLIVVLSAGLLIHQGLIKLRGKLYRQRKLPDVYQALSVITGSGYYRWSEK